jgi:hypothetical protein
MPERERRPQIPNWAERERTEDLAWISENLQEFWAVAHSGYESEGRGAIVVDTTTTPTDAGHLFGYVSEVQIRQLGATDEIHHLVKTKGSDEFLPRRHPRGTIKTRHS